MIAGVQVLAILFGIVMMYFTFLYYKKKQFQPTDLLLWATIWLGFTFAVMFPELFVGFLQPLVVQRVMDLITIGAFAVQFIIIFFLYKKTKNNEQSVKKLVRKIALK